MSHLIAHNRPDPLVTIVIPVYGVEKYIRRCMESVVNQSYKNLEIIVVNDATNDRSMDLVEKIKDERIKILNHSKNQGLAKSRNDGILASSGEYLIFLDSDDYLDLNFVENLLGIAIDTGADVVMSSTRIIEESGITVLLNREGERLRKYGEKIQALPNGGSCNKIYKSDLIKKNEIYFPVGRYWEDNIFTLKVAFYSELFVCTNSVCYNYVKRPESITTDPRKVQLLKRDGLLIAKQVIEFNKGKLSSVYEKVAIQVFILSNFISREWIKDLSYRKELSQLFVENGYSLRKGGAGLMHHVLFVMKFNLLKMMMRSSSKFIKNKFGPQYRRLRAYSKCLDLLVS